MKISTDESYALDNIVRYYEDLRFVKPILKGDVLIEMGVEQGPKVGVILQKLREAWLDGQVNDLESETALMMKIINND